MHNCPSKFSSSLEKPNKFNQCKKTQNFKLLQRYSPFRSPWPSSTKKKKPKISLLYIPNHRINPSNISTQIFLFFFKDPKLFEKRKKKKTKTNLTHRTASCIAMSLWSSIDSSSFKAPQVYLSFSLFLSLCLTCEGYEHQVM